jgi:hypothetical protein
MLLIHGNVAKMLPVKSEGACSLTLFPGLALLISQDNSGKIHRDLASNSPQAISRLFLERPLIALLKALVSFQKLRFA